MWWAALAAAAAGGGADRKPATPTASGPERARSSQSSRAGAASSSSNWWSSLGTAARLDAQQEGPSELCQEVVESDPSSDDEASHTASTGVGRRLFDGPALHPAGVGNWSDTRNCAAVLAYDCPCGRQCLHRVGDVIKIYEHRRLFRAGQQQVKSRTLRGQLRDSLAQHYDAVTKTFTPSFVVGSVGDVCERAYVVATAVGEATYVRARAEM